MPEQPTITYDPLNKFNVGVAQIDASMGLLPPWFTAAIVNNEKAAWDTLNDSYPFGMTEMKGGTVDPETLIYQYPEDPPLYPICVYKGNDKTLVFYQYAIVAVKEAGEQNFKITRMD